MGGVGFATFAGLIMEAVSGVELDAGLVGFDIHCAAGGWLKYFGNRSKLPRTAVQYEVVIVSAG